ncbi:MAG: DUF4340 domain-containing protein [Clostridia bacterium]|nr:DUF4340 domain-containing protein [Clostridia bacterium]
MKTKKKQITIIVLALVLIALILLYFLVIAPLIEENTTNKRPPAEAHEGEGLYYGVLTMYPTIDEDDVVLLTINNSHGTYSFINKIDEKTGSLKLALAKYPRLELDSSAISSLRIYTLNTQCVTNEPLRDCSPEMMEQYGVTRESCTMSYTVKFRDGDTEREHTVFIGDKTLSSDGSYFATVEGRNVIYEIDDGLESGLFIKQTDFVNPLIAAHYTDTEVVYEVNKILIGHSNSATPFVGIGATRVESKDTLLVNYTVQYPTNAKDVTASSSYISSALSKLLVSFTANKVVEIDPSEETKDKYGFGDSDVKKLISIGTFSDKEYIYNISQKQTGEDGREYYYLLSPAQTSKDVALILELSAENYEFLEQENAIKWIATNSFEAGFKKYIYAKEDIGESGVKDISIFANTNALKNFSDKFILTYSPHPTNPDKDDVLTVTSESGKYTFVEDTDANEVAYENEFNNFYAILVNYPMPNRFNTMTEAEREAAKTQEKLVLSIRVTLNDGTKMGYDYYMLDSANVMCEFFDDKTKEPKIVFDTTIQQVNILATALNQLISGEHVEKH